MTFGGEKESQKMGMAEYEGAIVSGADSGGRTAAKYLEIDPPTFETCFDRKPFVIRHQLSDHPLFKLSRLFDLSLRLPAENVEYNAGDVGVTLDPKLTPRTGLSVQETIRRIEECRSWMVLKNVECDDEYQELLDDCLDEIKVFSEPLFKGMCKREGFVFITSPGSVTPYHIDIEHNFLLQIRGTKTMNTFDKWDRSILSEQELEAFYSGAHRNLSFKDEYQRKAGVFELQPGMGLHVPLTTPHWVKNGDQVSISFSITFRTSDSERQSLVYEANARLRKLGFAPAPFGRSLFQDSAKYHAYRVFRRGNLVLNRFRSRPEESREKNYR
jgi:hypothetical protein